MKKQDVYSKSKAFNKLYERYEYLAKVYSRKLYDLHKIGYERQDLEQELKIKIYMCLKAYLRRWKEYRETGNYKPVPLKYFIQLSLNNRVKDFIKYVNRQNLVQNMSEFTVDIGIENYTTIDFLNKNVSINDIDVLQGLSKKELPLYCLHLKGYQITKIRKIGKNRGVNIDELIERQRLLLSKYKTDLYCENPVYTSVVSNIEE